MVFTAHCWGCCGVGRQVTWVGTWQDSLCLQNSQVGHGRPGQSPHIGSWAGWAPLGKNRASGAGGSAAQQREAVWWSHLPKGSCHLQAVG